MLSVIYHDFPGIMCGLLFSDVKWYLQTLQV